MKRYAITEAQLTTSGAIAHQNFDYGTDEAAAKGHYHMALASGIAGDLIACTVTLTMMDDENGQGYTQSETVKGKGTIKNEPEVTEG